jgi:hypothetical protein
VLTGKDVYCAWDVMVVSVSEEEDEGVNENGTDGRGRWEEWWHFLGFGHLNLKD